MAEYLFAASRKCQTFPRHDSTSAQVCADIITEALTVYCHAVLCRCVLSYLFVSGCQRASNDNAYMLIFIRSAGSDGNVTGFAGINQSIGQIKTKVIPIHPVGNMSICTERGWFRGSVSLQVVKLSNPNQMRLKCESVKSHWRFYSKHSIMVKSSSSLTLNELIVR